MAFLCWCALKSKSLTHSRLELVAALVSVKISALLQRELEYENITEWFWSDSKIVLGYIANDAHRFHIFVTNRVQQIREHAEPTQWRYVSTKDNHADVASRGATANELMNRSKWFTGPEFLWTPESLHFHESREAELSYDDPEVKKFQSFSTKSGASNFPSILERLEHFSSWQHAKTAVAICLNFKGMLQKRTIWKPQRTNHLEGTESIPSQFWRLLTYKRRS